MAYLKRHGIYNGKFIIAFCDYHLHRYWLYDEADLYLANIPEQIEEMRKLGVGQPAVAIGITLPPLLTVDKEAVRSKLGLPDKKVVLVSSGSLGIGFPPELLKEFIKQLTASRQDVHVVIVCGKNEALRQDLEKGDFPDTTVLGFYQPMGDLYAVADLFLTKPGGLSTAEGLQAGVPLQITHWLPGQEELNYRYLTARHLVHPVPPVLTAASLVKTVEAGLRGGKPGETPATALITQKNHEGEVLLNTIEMVFHGQFDEHEPIS
jgi:processive 1,2-diacylglycerol beta-glucosyltransferase